DREVDIGGGIRLSTYATGPGTHGWWATVILLIVIFMIFLMTIFSFLFLYGIHPEYWSAPADANSLWVILPVYAAGAALALLGRHLLARERSTHWSPTTQTLLAGAFLAVGWALDFQGWRGHGIEPE